MTKHLRIQPKILMVCFGMLMVLTSCQKLHDPKPSDLPVAPVVENNDTITPPVNPYLVVSDPLTNGMSVGIVTGGVFTPEGYKITINDGGYLLYETSLIEGIKVEFDAKGYIDREDAFDSKLIVMQIFDSPPSFNWGDRGVALGTQYRLYEIRKRGKIDGQTHFVTNGIMLKCGGGSDHNWLELGSWRGHCLIGHLIEWNPNLRYHWEITYRTGFTEIRRNGQLLFSTVTSPQFVPTGRLNVRIGGTPYRRGGPRDVTYSNVTISRF